MHRTLSPLFVRDVISGTSPQQRTEKLLGYAIDTAEALAGVAYLLDLSTGSFEEFVKSEPADCPWDQNLANTMDCGSLLGESFKKEGPVVSRKNSLTVVIAPGFRLRTCIGFIGLYLKEGAKLKEGVLAELEAIANFLAFIYHHRFAGAVLSHSHEPIDLHQEKEDYLDSLMQLAQRASGMRYLTLRRMEEGSDAQISLRAIKVLGFKETNPEYWNVKDLADYPTFEKALYEGDVVPESNMNKPYLRKMGLRPELEDLASFVAVPILVSNKIFGLLTLGTSCPYDYSEIELNGFRNIANGLGVAISNYENFHRHGADLTHWSEVATSITGMEVAQSARHETRGIIDDCQVQLALILNKSNRKISDVSDLLDELSENFSKVKKSLDKMRSATKPPIKELEHVQLREIWDQARSQVSGRLNELGIKATYEGSKKIEVEIFPDWFRQIFLNLLLNSIDAFSASRQKSGREIKLRIRKDSPKLPSVHMRYTDNATGVQFHMLSLTEAGRVKIGAKKLQEHQMIFEPGVTSKEDGSGWGLYLVRKILKDHRGSIDLINHRNGVAFDIVVPKIYNRVAKLDSTETVENRMDWEI